VRQALSPEKLKSVYGRIAGRYDFQHALINFRSDQRGRQLLVENAVSRGGRVLDCGAGTGTTGIMAARKVGPEGRVTPFDLSNDMLAVAMHKVLQARLQDRVTVESGDMVHLPFASGSFDTVLSSYSLCPLYDPEQGALELYRVARPGGRIAVAHSTEPRNTVIKLPARLVENAAWRMPWLSMGCRAVNVLPALEEAGGKVIFSKYIGVPLWPFFVFIIEKPLRDRKPEPIAAEPHQSQNMCSTTQRRTP
jgi:demethylmenaquinone methyltransferase / 2-methoxy-6-polyprenyl-1,4-benzoquinol methylase